MATEAANADVTTTVVAGTGVDSPTTANEIPARSATLWNPSDVGILSDSSVVFADTDHNQVRRITADGIIHRFAGGDTVGCNTEGTLLWKPQAVLSDRQGGAFLSNTQCGQVLHVDAQGSATRIAGWYGTVGNPPPFSNGMLATDAPIGQPGGLAYDAATDSLYFPDKMSGRVFKVRDGKITIVAGTSALGFSGDEGLATSAQLKYPCDVAFHDGKLYIADCANTRVRMVDESGIIHTVVGTGGLGDTGDGGPATQATLDGISNVTFSPAGLLHIASSRSGAIRAVDATGNISTVASLSTCIGGITFDGDGNIFAVSPCAQYVYRLQLATPPPPVPDCPPLQFVGVRGSGETASDAGGYGTTVDDVRSRLATQIPGMSSVAIDYPAIPVDWTDPGYKPRYQESIGKGITKTTDTVQTLERACPDSKLVLAAFSQGGHVAGDALDQLSEVEKANVILVVFGDPRFNPKQNFEVDQGDFKNLYGAYIKWDANTSPRLFTASQAGHVRSYCTAHDPVCNFKLKDARDCAFNSPACSHLHYVELGYTKQAADWVLSLLG